MLEHGNCIHNTMKQPLGAASSAARRGGAIGCEGELRVWIKGG